ncbi:Polyadenylate-binding_protein [Hexamita inflata]|uniref:Polyadenylate-binding protein n=1 Tax=Hexamita inflata TaxID=28002 RepID=A0AA86NEZ3_9EUKA|nr:Polyadenylate-binding protein [Hexamita inflata]
MSSVIVSNIPENCTANEVQDIFKIMKIPNISNESFGIQNSKSRNASSGRFVVLNFQDKTDANDAIKIINQTPMIFENKQTIIHAAPYVTNLNSLLKTSLANIAVFNLPPEMTTENLKQIFGEFGTIISAVVQKPHQNVKYSTGYVLFEKVAQADKAIRCAHKQFIGAYQLYVHKTNNNSQVILSRVPSNFGAAEIENYILSIVDTEKIPATDIFTYLPKLSQEPLQSKKLQVTFTCKTRQIALKVIELINACPININGKQHHVQAQFDLQMMEANQSMNQ